MRSLEHLCAVAAWQYILCVLCNKTFSSVRCYQQHHRRVHLQEFEHECSVCGLCFLSRSSFQAHHCVPRRRRVNVKKRQVLAARMQEKMRSTSGPYFVFVDSENQVMTYAGDTGNSIKETFLQQLLPSANKADSNGFVDTLESEVTTGSGFLQNDAFQMTDSSEAVLSCLPQCDRELLHSATMETLSGELEMDVCDALETEDGCAGMEQPATAEYSDSDSLLVDADVGKIPTENCEENGPESTSSSQVAEPAKTEEADDDVGKTQQWPMATLLSDGRLQCNVCQKELRVANYYPHMRRVHKLMSKRSRPIVWKVCERCGYQCQDNYKLRRHVMKHSRYGQFLSRSFRRQYLFVLIHLS